MTSPDVKATDTAWRIHTQLADWTGKVDRKATFAISIESAVLAGVIATSGTGELLGDLTGVRLIFYWIGLGLMVIGILASVAAVFPQMGRRPSEVVWKNGLIYFGHLRYWDAGSLAQELRNPNILAILARQLVIMSVILWRKHRCLQVSFEAAIVGAGLLVLAALLPHP